jgi:hypothetical protein
VTRAAILADTLVLIADAAIWGGASGRSVCPGPVAGEQALLCLVEMRDSYALAHGCFSGEAW